MKTLVIVKQALGVKKKHDWKRLLFRVFYIPLHKSEKKNPGHVSWKYSTAAETQIPSH